VKQSCLSLLAILITTQLCLTTPSLNAAESGSTETHTPRSVILIIGDGFDDQHLTMARNYLAGNAGTLGLDALPVRGAVQIETVSPDGTRLYAADSANTATSLATGAVTNIGRIGTDAQDRDRVTVLELAAHAGYATGLVSTSSVTDATPASFAAHVNIRMCEGPDITNGGELYGQPFSGCPSDATQNGGAGSIAEQLAKAPVDILLGGGAKFFDQSIPGQSQTVIEWAQAQGVRVIRQKDNLANLPASGRVIGLFDKENLEVRWRGTDGRTAENADVSWLNRIDWRLGSSADPEPMECEPNPDYGDTPSLAAMTEAALTGLAARSDKGLFLMVESASIDKQSHKRNPCGSIGEIEQLEEALAAALRFADDHPNTLVIVTADHAQAAQILPEPSLFAAVPVPVYSPGKVARVKTPEGGVMRINYATNNFPKAEEHTGANVPLFGNAVAQGVLKPFMRQRDVHQAMLAYLGLNEEETTP